MQSSPALAVAHDPEKREARLSGEGSEKHEELEQAHGGAWQSDRHADETSSRYMAPEQASQR